MKKQFEDGKCLTLKTLKALNKMKEKVYRSVSLP
jgi:hypothetical protein